MQNEKVVRLMIDAEKFAWHLVDATAFDHVINWHVMSCDPRVILCTEIESVHPIDTAVNKYEIIIALFT